MERIQSENLPEAAADDYSGYRACRRGQDRDGFDHLAHDPRRSLITLGKVMIYHLVEMGQVAQVALDRSGSQGDYLGRGMQTAQLCC